MLRIPFFNRSKPDPAEPLVREEDAKTVSAFVEALRHEMRDGAWFGGSGLNKMAESHLDLYHRITELKGNDRGYMALALLRKAKSIASPGYAHREYWIREDLVQLAGRLVSARGAVPLELFPRFVELWVGTGLYGVTYARITGVAEDLVAEHGLLPEIQAVLRPLLEKLDEPRVWGTGTVDERRQAMRLRQVVDPEGAAEASLAEPWQAPFREARWAGLLQQASLAKTNTMSDKWAKAAHPFLQEAGTEAFLDAFEASVDALRRMPNAVDAVHSDMLRGLGWMAGLIGTPRAAFLLGRLVQGSAQKIEYVGARSQKGFGGAVGALERMGTFESLAALSNARNRIKAATLSAALAAALTRAAERQALPIEELEELVVPTYGLDLPGVRLESLGTVEARLEIVGTTDAELRWFREGKELKAPPAEVKDEHADVLKELKGAKKEIEATLLAQRARIESLMLSGRTLPYAQWRERYLEHPLLANMVRRLVWRFADTDGERLGIAPNGEPLDVEGRPLEGLSEETTVRLWHPIHAGVSAIEAWRDFLFAQEIRQPFKQAYREIYLLTVAEERTRTYSNRFAAHVLKQHQFNALARGRGWRYALQGYFDSQSTPTLELPQWGLQAEYFVQVADMGGLPQAEAMSESGIAVYVVTDQVRFNDAQSRQPVLLAQVPPIVLSEVFRDVDLFVGVASVGNDPTWADQGARTRYGGYWREVSFGDLSLTAQTRKAVLERLLPRLAVGKVSRIEGKFLVVKGKRRTYKIHLGSGNILMEPNDQYLCIVPGGKDLKADRVYLPFEGDGVLAIILSKAMMLMNDDKITDPSITRQL